MDETYVTERHSVGEQFFAREKNTEKKPKKNEN